MGTFTRFTQFEDDVQGGDITFGGTPIRDLQVAALRGAFSVVAQDIVIFNASIWDNIRYVNPQASEAQVWQAAEPNVPNSPVSPM